LAQGALSIEWKSSLLRWQRAAYGESALKKGLKRISREELQPARAKCGFGWLFSFLKPPYWENLFHCKYNQLKYSQLMGALSLGYFQGMAGKMSE
jgi:hypothetical protein